MAYALKGLLFPAAVQQQSAAHSRKPIRLTHTVVKANQTPTQAAKAAKAAIGKLAASASAAALLLALPAHAVQAPSLFEGNTSYQQELQDLIDKRGSLPSLSPQDISKAASDVKKAAGKAEFKLPDVSKGAVETPKELERALPEAFKNLPPPPTPTPSSSMPGQPKAEGSKAEAPKAPQLPKIETPKPPSLPTPPQPSTLPQQDGGGLPAPYLAAGGVAAAAIVGIGLAGAKPDQAPSSSPQSSVSAAPKSSGSAAPKSSGGSSGGMPEGKDPEMDSATAKKKDPFFKEVAKRTK